MILSLPVLRGTGGFRPPAVPPSTPPTPPRPRLPHDADADADATLPGGALPAAAQLTAVPTALAVASAGVKALAVAAVGGTWNCPPCGAGVLLPPSESKLALTKPTLQPFAPSFAPGPEIEESSRPPRRELPPLLLGLVPAMVAVWLATAGWLSTSPAVRFIAPHSTPTESIGPRPRPEAVPLSSVRSTRPQEPGAAASLTLADGGGDDEEVAEEPGADTVEGAAAAPPPGGEKKERML